MVAAVHCEQLQGQQNQSCSVAAAKALRAAEEGLQRAVTELEQNNGQLVQDTSFFVQEVGELEELQQRACGSAVDNLDSCFSPEVLDILKGNADQLFQLKQGVVAEKLAAKEGTKKLMLWMSGSPAGQQEQPHSGNAATAAGQLPASDAVKQRGIKLLQLPGSSIAAARSATGAAGWQALKFWQVGAQHNKHAVPSSRAAADTPGVADQQPQMQKSLSSMLFGKQKRHSSGGAEGAAAAAHRRLSIDPAASWRSSVDGSLNGRRASARSSEAGAVAGAAGAAAGTLSSLAAGEGPLSKSHSLLATKPGTQQEQIMGKSLEIVAEDEREGRDSPAPAELPGHRAGSVGQPAGLAPIRVPRGSLGLGNRPGSPVDSFSFGPRAEEDQPQSPSFLRASSAASRMGQQAGMAGPLVRSSMALRASSAARMDPFEAPEPEAQPFVEQMRAEQQQECVAQPGLMAALRRSISGAGSNSRRTPRQSVEGAAWAGRQAQQAAYQQQQQERAQQASEAGVQFLDLDATRAYALGVHQVMMRLEQGMQSHHSQLEASSKPASPRMASCFAAAAAAPAPAETVAAAEADASDAASSEEQAPSEQGSHQQLQEGEVEVQEDGDEAADGQQRQSAQGASVGDSRPSQAGPLSAGHNTLHAADAAAVPPLRSGMSSPAGSRRQTLVTASRAGSAAPRQLPLMGQASMEILTKPQHQQQHGSLSASRQTSLVGASTSLSLAEVYKQTSGNLTPLSSHLSGIGRRPSSGVNKSLPGPQQFSSSRSILGDAGPQAGGGASGGLGPLSMQCGSTMQQAKKSAHAAGLAAGVPEQQRMQGPAGWSGPSPIPAAGVTPEGGDAAAGANNKYASSWGILDAGGLSRQSSMNRVQASRAPSNAQLGRQGSGSVRASPRVSTTDDGTWQQQQRLRGAGAAAGRYAGTSLTPGSQSPRSGTATPAREDSSTAMVGHGRQASAAGRGRRAGGAGREQREQGPAGRGGMQARDGSTAGSDGDYESAEEQLSSGPSGLSGLSGPYGSANGGGTAAPGGQAPSAAGSTGLPRAPTFAQAAVATQWSPSKNAAAYSQAPAYMRDAVLRISPEMSGNNMGLAPQGLQAHSSRGVSPWDGSSTQGVPPPGRVSSSSIGASRTSHASGYEVGGSGSINIYAPLDPPAPRSSSGRLSSGQQYRVGGQQAPGQQVVTAVDLARRSSMMRRGSSQGGEYVTGLSSNGRTSSSSNMGYMQASPSSGYGGTVGGRQGGQQQQQQQQQPWGQGSSSMHSAGIYGTIRPQQWQQRTQYRL